MRKKKTEQQRISGTVVVVAFISLAFTCCYFSLAFTHVKELEIPAINFDRLNKPVV